MSDYIVLRLLICRNDRKDIDGVKHIAKKRGGERIPQKFRDGHP